ncbi:MAG TPA: hypothetical protein VL977_01145, partial [Solirubrobacteraceae bacterium]|nr:hypothetical protein [Solirubrobacteraceae bacterium]
MAEAPDPGRGDYKRYGPRRLRRGPRMSPEEGLAELRSARTTLAGGEDADAAPAPRRRWPRRRRRARRPRKLWVRALRWLLAAVAAWIGVSVVIFLISSLVATGVDAAAVAALTPGGTPPFSATTILVLG